MSLKVPSREQLKKFLPDHESIVQFEQLFGSATSLEQLLNIVILSAGLNANGTYTPESTAHYINVATTLFNADKILDQAIFDYSIGELCTPALCTFSAPLSEPIGFPAPSQTYVFLNSLILCP